VSVNLETTRVYAVDDVPTGAWQPSAQERQLLDGKLTSAFVRAVKP
jgi:hypothetical protein